MDFVEKLKRYCWEQQVDEAWTTYSKRRDRQTRKTDSGQLRFSGVTQAAVSRLLRGLRAHAFTYWEGPLSAPPDVDEKDSAETEARIARLSRGELSAIPIQYSWRAARCTLRLFGTVTLEPTENLRVTMSGLWWLFGDRRHDLEWKFHALLEHAWEISPILGVWKFEVGEQTGSVEAGSKKELWIPMRW